MKTLLVDDNPFALKLLSRQLELLGCVDLVLCERAQDAMEVLDMEREGVGLVFCDLQMPDVDGVEFVRYLARMGYAGHLVLVSGEDTRILQTVVKLAEAHQITVVAALSKPISNATLKQALDAHVARGTAKPRAARQRFGTDELRTAITQGQMLNYYQPKVEIATRKLVGVEALVRWKHPTLGIVPPDSFIPTVEESGLIRELTDRVLVSALRQTRMWHDAGLPLQVSVNVSMISLTDLRFPDTLEARAKEAGLPMSTLALEVTESRLMRDVRATLDILTRLRLKRVGLSIDDFGTGHSSLVQLRDIPFDELKLDKSFIHGAAGNPALSAIVEPTLAMAHQLGLKSVAEGVEDRSDWEYLAARRCDIAQGYFIARPMPGDDIRSWHEEWKAHQSLF